MSMYKCEPVRERAKWSRDDLMKAIKSSEHNGTNRLFDWWTNRQRTISTSDSLLADRSTDVTQRLYRRTPRK